MNIYQRVNEVRKEIAYIQKDKSVSTGGGSYKAVTHDAVTGMVRAPLIKHGIVIIPTLLWERSLPKEEGQKQFRHEAGYRFRFQNIDDKEDFFEVDTLAHAMDNADKSPGKALSYATKYAILKVFNIETGEDEESRFGTEEFDVLPHLDAILACQSMSDLKTTYEKSYKLAEDIKNKDAMKAIIAAKDKTKSIINEKTKARIDNEMAGQA